MVWLMLRVALTCMVWQHYMSKPFLIDNYKFDLRVSVKTAECSYSVLLNAPIPYSNVPAPFFVYRISLLSMIVRG